MTEVLERLGYQVDFPEAQTCCGQPAFNTGYHEEARTIARHFLDVFRDAEYIVVPSGSCTSMISHHFADIFEHDPKLLAEAHALEPRVWEFSRFLLEVAERRRCRRALRRRRHLSRQLPRLARAADQGRPAQAAGQSSGPDAAEMDAAEECCGFGGTFSVKFPEVSGAMARTKIDSIQKTGAATVVSIDSSCLMQLQGVIDRAGLPIRTLHLAEVLASR